MVPVQPNRPIIRLNSEFSQFHCLGNRYSDRTDEGQPSFEHLVSSNNTVYQGNKFSLTACLCLVQETLDLNGDGAAARGPSLCYLVPRNTVCEQHGDVRLRPRQTQQRLDGLSFGEVQIPRAVDDQKSWLEAKAEVAIGKTEQLACALIAQRLVATDPEPIWPAGAR